MKPVAPKDISNQHHLGNLLNHFPVFNHGRKRWLTVILGGISILVAIGLTIQLIANTSENINIHGRAVVLRIFPYPVALFAGLFFGGLLAVILAILSWHDGITLFETGLILRKGNRDHTWIYKDTSRFDTYITNINFGGSVVSISAQIILENGNNQRLMIKNKYDKMPVLVDNLRGLILPELIKKCRLQLHSGENLFFHKFLQINKDNIIIEGSARPIADVDYLQRNKVFTLFDKNNPKKRYLKLKYHQIRNLDVLIDLLENPLEDHA
jgi:hypothetical protein